MVIKNFDFDFTRWNTEADFIEIMGEFRQEIKFQVVSVPVVRATNTDEGIPTDQPLPPVEVKMLPKMPDGDPEVFTMTFRPQEQMVIRILCQAHDVYTIAYEAKGKWSYHEEFKEVFEATGLGDTTKQGKGKGKYTRFIPFECNYLRLRNAANMDREKLKLGKRELIKALKALYNLDDLRAQDLAQARIVEARALLTITHMVPECLRFSALMYHASNPEIGAGEATTNWEKFCDYIAACRKDAAHKFLPVTLMDKLHHPIESGRQPDMNEFERLSWPPSTIENSEDLLNLVVLIKYNEEIAELELQATRTQREILQAKGLSKRHQSGSSKFNTPAKASHGHGGSTAKDTRGRRSSSDKGKGKMRQQTGANCEVAKYKKSVGARLIRPLFRVLARRAVSVCGIPAACEKSHSVQPRC